MLSGISVVIVALSGTRGYEGDWHHKCVKLLSIGGRTQYDYCWSPDHTIENCRDWMLIWAAEYTCQLT